MAVKLPARALSLFEGEKVVLVTSSGQVKVGIFTGVESVGMKDCIMLKNPTSFTNISYMESIDEVNCPSVEEKESISEGSNSDLVDSS